MNIKMNSATRIKRIAFLGNSIAVAITALGGMAMAGETAHAGWLERSLLSPSPAQIEQERKGHITIYEGLTDVTVEKAMDEQFPRIGAMMFVGTIVTDADGVPATDPESGEVEVEDDGCD